MDVQALDVEIGLGKVRALRAREKYRRRAEIKDSATRTCHILSIRGFLGEIINGYKKLAITHGGKGFEKKKNFKHEKRVRESVQLLSLEMQKIGVQLVEPPEIPSTAYENAHTLNKAYVDLAEYWGAMLLDPTMPWA